MVKSDVSAQNADKEIRKSRKKRTSARIFIARNGNTSLLCWRLARAAFLLACWPLGLDKARTLISLFRIEFLTFNYSITRLPDYKLLKFVSLVIFVYLGWSQRTRAPDPSMGLRL